MITRQTFKKNPLYEMKKKKKNISPDAIRKRIVVYTRLELEP